MILFNFIINYQNITIVMIIKIKIFLTLSFLYLIFIRKNLDKI